MAYLLCGNVLRPLKVSEENKKRLDALELGRGSTYNDKIGYLLDFFDVAGNTGFKGIIEAMLD